MKKTLLAIWAALSVGLILLPAHAQVPEKKDVSIAVGGRVALYYLPLNIAESKGYFKSEGLNVKVMDFQGGTKSVQAVVGGSADILSSSYEHLITLQSKNQYLKEFVLQGRYPGFALTVSKKLAEKYKSPADLKGMKVGVTAPGSSTHMMLKLLLEKAGVNQDDVAVIGVGAGASALAAMQNGQVDAEIQADPATTLLVSSGLGVVKVDSRAEEGTRLVYGGPMPGASLSAPVDFIKKYPRTVQALTNAMVKALRFLATASDEEILASIPPEMLLGGNKELYLQMVAAVRLSYSKDGLITPAATETALRVLASENSDLKSGIDLSKTYDNSFVSTALKNIK
jgi:NitT/TauT family transport system substrate-binding protein